MLTSAALTASWLIAAAGVILAVGAAALTRRLLAGLPLLLDLLLAAGLLRLSSSSQWAPVIATAVVVLVRKLVLAGLGQSRTSGPEAAVPS